MNVFLDTNILIDVIENREGTVFAKQLLQLGKDKKINIYASFLSFANSHLCLRVNSCFITFPISNSLMSGTSPFCTYRLLAFIYSDFKGN